MKTRILIVDDHKMLAEGLRCVLSQRDDLEVVAIATDGREAVRQASRLRPDVVLMDITLPGLNGIEATARIRERHPGTLVVILSAHNSAEHVYRALRAGASGYVVKDSGTAELIKAVREVRLGRRYFGRTLHGLERFSAAARSPVERLSAREREVLQLVMEGRPSAEIAGMLGLSPKTVDTYRSRLMGKLGVKDVPSLARIAIQLGLV